MEKAYVLWRAFQDKVLGPIAALILLGCTLLALVEVVRRYGLGLSFEWQQDLVTYFILSAVFLYFGIAQRREAHLNVTVCIEILQALGPRARRVAEFVRVVATAFSMLFLLAVGYLGIPEVEDSLRYASRTESLAFPMWPFLLALLVGFAFMAMTLFFQLYRGIQALRGRKVLEEPPDAEAPVH